MIVLTCSKESKNPLIRISRNFLGSEQLEVEKSEPNGSWEIANSNCLFGANQGKLVLWNNANYRYTCEQLP